MFRAAMLPAGVCLVVGMALGLARIGWDVWPGWATPVAAHGSLMVGGFLGTLIALERARAVGRRVSLAAPLASGAGGLALVAGAPAAIAGGLLVAGSAGLVACYGVVLRRRNDLAGWTQLAGAVALATGLGCWAAGWEPFQVADWWIAFLVLSVAGERLELTRLLPRFGARAAWFLAALAPLVPLSAHRLADIRARLSARVSRRPDLPGLRARSRVPIGRAGAAPAVRC